MDTGPATSYSLENLQQRGTLFVAPQEPVYAGMVVGENSRTGDMPCNPTKRKQMTNFRSNKELAMVLAVPRKHTLDTAIEWIAQDELVEVTPKSVRIRKAVLDATQRKRLERQLAAMTE
jgi:GTP-binding protein